jgi:ATP phosphoribosyltransferase
MLLGSVVAARATRYLLCNVPASRVEAVVAALPTTGSPTVMPLASRGLCAVHALVPASAIFRLLPTLEALGATSILTLPVERMVR